MDKAKILIVDDDEDILALVSYNLTKEGYEVYKASNGIEAVEVAKKTTPHLILLDVMMPGMDGVETCVELRALKQLEATLIVFLSARNEDYSQIAGLEAGGDDYLTKPIKPRLLVSRIKALLRRSVASNENKTSNTSEIIIDAEKYIVLKDGESFNLPRKEFELLKLLMSSPGKVFERNEILDKVWGAEVFVGDRTIDVHIRKLREKLGSHVLTTIKGVGYKFEA